MDSYFYFMLFLTVHLCHWKYGYSVKSLRHSECLDDLLGSLPQESFRASSVRQSDTNQFQPYQVWLKEIWDSNGLNLVEAWCPAEPVDSNKQSWLEINFPSLYLVNRVLTKGRREGNVEEFTPGYMLEYQREDNVKSWFTYRMENGTQIVAANSNSYNHVRIHLDDPIIAKRIRLYPISSNLRNKGVCLKLKLFGCRFKDGVVEYRAPAAFRGFDEVLTIRGGMSYNFEDRSYDMHSKACRVDRLTNSLETSKDETICWLSGGMGILMDDQIYDGGSPLSFSSDSEALKYFLGWKKSNESPSIKLVFRFYDIHEINSLDFYVVNYPDLEMASFQQVALRATVTDLCTNFGQNSQPNEESDKEGASPLILDQIADERLVGPRKVPITLTKSPYADATLRPPPLVGRHLCVELIPFKRFLLLGEVVINATRKVLSPEEIKRLENQERGEMERKKTTFESTTETAKETVKFSEYIEPTGRTTQNVTSPVMLISPKSFLMSGYPIIMIIMALFLLCLLAFAMLLLRCNLASRCCGKHCCSRLHARRCTSFPQNCRQHCYSAGAVNYTEHYINDLRMSPKCNSQKWIDYIPSPSHCTSSSYPLVRSNAESPVNLTSAFFYPSPGGKLNPVNCPPMYSIHPDSASYIPASSFYPPANPNMLHFPSAPPTGQYNPALYMNASAYLFSPHHSVSQFTDDNKTVSSQTPTYIAACSTLTDDSNTSHVYELANTVSSQLPRQGCSSGQLKESENSENKGNGSINSPRPSISVMSNVSPSNVSGRKESKEKEDEDETTEKILWNCGPGSSANSSSGRGSSETSSAHPHPPHARSSVSEYVNEPSPSTSSGNPRPPLPPNHPSTQIPFQYSQDVTSTLISPYAVQGLIPEKNTTPAVVAPAPAPPAAKTVNGSLSPPNKGSKSHLHRQRSKGRDSVHPCPRDVV